MNEKFTVPKAEATADSQDKAADDFIAAFLQRLKDRRERQANGTEAEYEQKRWEEKWQAIYAKRRHKSIYEAHDEYSPERDGNSRGYYNPCSYSGTSQILVEKLVVDLFLAKICQGHPLTELASGECGFENAIHLTGHGARDERYVFSNSKDIGATKITLVDPYAGGFSQEQKDRFVADQTVPAEVRSDVNSRINVVEERASAYLIEQKPGSQNVFVASLDRAIISEENSIRIAQEIFRVIPEDGIFLSILSEDIENEAAKLFPYHYFSYSEGDTHYFSKSPLPVAAQMELIEDKLQASA